MAEQDKITAQYVPPPEPPPGKIVVTPPKDSRGNPVFPFLHLTPDQAHDLWYALGVALDEYESNRD